MNANKGNMIGPYVISAIALCVGIAALVVSLMKKSSDNFKKCGDDNEEFEIKPID